MYVNWQTMLFDRSVGTRNHQDSWYLDNDPPGGVIGAWIALGDISMDCGPFKIYERTNRKRIDPSACDFADLEHDRAFRLTIIAGLQSHGTRRSSKQPQSIPCPGRQRQ